MRGYVYSKELGFKNNCSISAEIFKESEAEFRPIIAATKDDNNSGFNKKVSFPTQKDAMEYLIKNQDDLVEEAIKDAIK
ncbi:MAG: hypothetical protein H0X02_00790 [Nitrosomonas sp.]|nr:hypothetical protein [Nitrosomonas sp.]